MVQPSAVGRVLLLVAVAAFAWTGAASAATKILAMGDFGVGGSTERELATPVYTPGQEQVRHVHTRDHEHQADRAKDGEERGAYAASDVVLERGGGKRDLSSIRLWTQLPHDSLTKRIDFA